MLRPLRWAQLTPAQLVALRRRACEAELLFSGKDSNKDEFVTAGGTSAPTTAPFLPPYRLLTAPLHPLTALSLPSHCPSLPARRRVVRRRLETYAVEARARSFLRRRAFFLWIHPPHPPTHPSILTHDYPPLNSSSPSDLPRLLAGELLDVDGVTGGHNFQSCWTTGMVAGTEAAKVALALAATETAAPPPTSYLNTD